MLLHIAFDIQLEIFKRLPVKSLIQLRSVCKAWKAFIDSSEFIAAYSITHTQSQHLMIRYEVGYGEESEVESVCFVDDDTFPQQKFVPTVPPLLQLIDGSWIIGSSRGLLFLDGFFRESDDSITNVAVLWNPSIRKSIVVALPNVAHPSFGDVIGFGVCPDTNDPKLVKITYIDEYQNMESISCIPNQVMVFTLSSRQWAPSCSNQLPRKSIQFTSSSTVIGRFIYWCAYDRIDVDGEPRNLIMSFDMSSQEFREIDLPYSLAGVRMSVSCLRESLVLLDYNIHFTTNEQICDVWMIEHGDSKAFTKIFTINAPNASVSQTLGFTKSGEPIVEMHDDDEAFATLCSLVVFEPCSEHIKDLGIHGNIFFGSSYTESLLLLDHNVGHIVRCGDVKG